MAKSLEAEKASKRRKKKQLRHYKAGSPKWLATRLAIGRINKRIRKQKRVRTAEEARVERGIREARRCIKTGLHYVWGGGHITPAPGPQWLKDHDSGYDCSSYASHVVQVMVPGVETGTTFTLADELPKGEGKYVTLFIKNSPANDAHVIMRIVFRGKAYWTQCGGRDNTKPGDGPCWFVPTRSRIEEFPIHVHPEGL